MHKPINRQIALETMLVIALGCMFFGWLSKHQWLFWLAGIVLLIAIAVPKLAEWLTTGWLKLAGLLGEINSRVLLSLIFYICLTPLGYFYRISKGDYLQLLKKQEKDRSYWTTRDHTYEASDIEKVW